MKFDTMKLGAMALTLASACLSSGPGLSTPQTKPGLGTSGFPTPSLSSSAFNAGFFEGNGGNTVIANGQYYVLDLYEKGVHVNPWIDLSVPVPSALLARVQSSFGQVKDAPVVLVAQKLGEIARYSPNAAWQLLRAMEMYSWGMVTDPLPTIHDDVGGLQLTKQQTAMRLKHQIYLAADIWAQMSPENRAALIFHEVVYSLTSPSPGLGWNMQDVKRAKTMVGHLFSTDLPQKGFAGLKTLSSFPVLGGVGYEVMGRVSGEILFAPRDESLFLSWKVYRAGFASLPMKQDSVAVMGTTFQKIMQSGYSGDALLRSICQSVDPFVGPWTADSMVLELDFMTRREDASRGISGVWFTDNGSMTNEYLRYGAVSKFPISTDPSAPAVMEDYELGAKVQVSLTAGDLTNANCGVGSGRPLGQAWSQLLINVSSDFETHTLW